MKFRTIATVASIIVFFAANAFGAGYVKFEGIEGEARDKNHQGWSDVLAVSGIPAPRDAASGMATGKRQHKPLTITKPIDKATPMLARVQQGQALGRVEISTAGTTYELVGAKVLSVKRSGDTEMVSLSYQSLNTRAQDYNSSRSNKSSLRAAAVPANHNTTRSNKTVE
jgi:type VI secretion system secreted protein Hcp